MFSLLLLNKDRTIKWCLVILILLPIALPTAGNDAASADTILGEQRLFYSATFRRQLDRMMLNSGDGDDDKVSPESYMVNPSRSEPGSSVSRFDDFVFQGFLQNPVSGSVDVWANGQRWSVSSAMGTSPGTYSSLPLTRVVPEVPGQQDVPYRLRWAVSKRLIIMECHNGIRVEIRVGQSKKNVCQRNTDGGPL